MTNLTSEDIKFLLNNFGKKLQIIKSSTTVNSSVLQSLGKAYARLYAFLERDFDRVQPIIIEWLEVIVNIRSKCSQELFLVFTEQYINTFHKFFMNENLSSILQRSILNAWICCVESMSKNKADDLFLKHKAYYVHLIKNKLFSIGNYNVQMKLVELLYKNVKLLDSNNADFLKEFIEDEEAIKLFIKMDEIESWVSGVRRFLNHTNLKLTHEWSVFPIKVKQIRINDIDIKDFKDPDQSNEIWVNFNISCIPSISFEVGKSSANDNVEVFSNDIGFLKTEICGKLGHLILGVPNSVFRNVKDIIRETESPNIKFFFAQDANWNTLLKDIIPCIIRINPQNKINDCDTDTNTINVQSSTSGEINLKNYYQERQLRLKNMNLLSESDQNTVPVMSDVSHGNSVSNSNSKNKDNDINVSKYLRTRQKRLQNLNLISDSDANSITTISQVSLKDKPVGKNKRLPKRKLYNTRSAANDKSENSQDSQAVRNKIMSKKQEQFIKPVVAEIVKTNVTSTDAKKSDVQSTNSPKYNNLIVQTHEYTNDEMCVSSEDEVEKSNPNKELGPPSLLQKTNLEAAEANNIDNGYATSSSPPTFKPPVYGKTELEIIENNLQNINNAAAKENSRRIFKNTERIFLSDDSWRTKTVGGKKKKKSSTQVSRSSRTLTQPKSAAIRKSKTSTKTKSRSKSQALNKSWGNFEDCYTFPSLHNEFDKKKPRTPNIVTISDDENRVTSTSQMDRNAEQKKQLNLDKSTFKSSSARKPLRITPHRRITRVTKEKTSIYHGENNIESISISSVQVISDIIEVSDDEADVESIINNNSRKKYNEIFNKLIVNKDRKTTRSKNTEKIGFKKSTTAGTKVSTIRLPINKNKEIQDMQEIAICNTSATKNCEDKPINLCDQEVEMNVNASSCETIANSIAANVNHLNYTKGLVESSQHYSLLHISPMEPNHDRQTVNDGAVARSSHMTMVFESPRNNPNEKVVVEQRASSWDITANNQNTRQGFISQSSRATFGSICVPRSMSAGPHNLSKFMSSPEEETNEVELPHNFNRVEERRDSIHNDNDNTNGMEFDSFNMDDEHIRRCADQCAQIFNQTSLQEVENIVQSTSELQLSDSSMRSIHEYQKAAEQFMKSAKELKESEKAIAFNAQCIQSTSDDLRAISNDILTSIKISNNNMIQQKQVLDNKMIEFHNNFNQECELRKKQCIDKYVKHTLMEIQDHMPDAVPSLTN